MNKFHINKNGVPALCKASVQPCPLGGQHFESSEDAHKYLQYKYCEFGRFQEKLLTNQLYSAHEASQRFAFVKKEIEAASYNEMGTNHTFFDKDTQSWTPERKKVHQEILNTFLEKYKNVPCDKRVVFSAGLPGAGKTTVLKKYEKLDPDNWATISADDIKELLAKKGCIPEIEGLSPMECSTLVHEESSMLAKQLLFKLSNEGKNIIYDFTCKNKKSGNSIIGELKDYGYETRNMQFVFVNITPEVAHERARNRYIDGLNDSLDENNDNQIGGRFLPPDVIDGSATEKGDKFESTNALAIFELHTISNLGLPTPKIYNNSGDFPVEINFEDFIN